MSTNIERFSSWVEQLLVIEDPGERASFLEAVNLRTDSGCVVRALESAFRVEATDEEWDMRISDVQALREDFKSLDSVSEPLLQAEVSLTKRAIDRKQVKIFMARVAERDTPLGKALKSHNITEGVLGCQDISQLVATGKIVLVDIVREKSRHLVCVGIVDGGLVSLNDDNQRINLSENDKYLVFVFAPNGEN